MLTHGSRTVGAVGVIALVAAGWACDSDTRSRRPAEQPSGSGAPATRPATTPPERGAPPPAPLARNNTAHRPPDAPRRAPPTTLPARPRLLRADPAAADLGTGAVVEVTLFGTGFTPGGNIVTFGGIPIGAVTSASRRSLRFTVPTQYPPLGEAPPRNLAAGRYAVTVSNTNGVSDTMSFRLLSGPP